MTSAVDIGNLLSLKIKMLTRLHFENADRSGTIATAQVVRRKRNHGS